MRNVLSFDRADRLAFFVQILAKFRTSFTYDISGTFITLPARRHWPKFYESNLIHYNVCDCQLRANDGPLRARINFWPINQETRLADQLQRGCGQSIPVHQASVRHQAQPYTPYQLRSLPAGRFYRHSHQLQRCRPLRCACRLFQQQYSLHHPYPTRL